MLLKPTFRRVNALPNVIIFAAIMKRIIPVNMPILITKRARWLIAHGGPVQSYSINIVRHCGWLTLFT